MEEYYLVFVEVVNDFEIKYILRFLEKNWKFWIIVNVEGFLMSIKFGCYYLFGW